MRPDEPRQLDREHHEDDARMASGIIGEHHGVAPDRRRRGAMMRLSDLPW
jgi:hypothetical protein